MTETFWTPERIERLRQLAATLTGSQIAIELGSTRNAVLGAAHRHGIRLCAPRKQERDYVAMGRKSSGRKGKVLPPDHPSHRSRPKGAHAFAFKDRVHAVAARLAGASRPVAARIVGASPVTLNKLWERDEAVVEAARRVLVQAVSDARSRLAARQRVVEAQRNAAMAHNRRVLEGWGERNRTIVMRKLSGESLSTIGRDFGLTRERCRQILGRAIDQGLISPPGVNLKRDRVA